MSGESKIPVARVNRIVKADKEVRLCSKEAVFLISKATVSCILRLCTGTRARVDPSLPPSLSPLAPLPLRPSALPHLSSTVHPPRRSS